MAPRQINYPAAGTANADVQLWLVDPSNGPEFEVDWRHGEFEYLVSPVGFLGTVAQVIDNTDVTSKISEFLLTLVAHFADDNNNKKDHKALEIPVECLNLLYDIFGDAAYAYDEPVFVGGNYLQRLQQLEPSVRAFYKKIDRNRNAGLKLRAEEAWGNLGRFIEYKRAERR